MEFRTKIVLGSKTATGFQVPDEVVEGLGSGKKPKVTVTIGKHTYRSTIAPMGGVFMLPLSAENRQAAGVAAGDEVTVQIELDTEPREITVPDDFSATLDQNSVARQYFDGLSYSNKRRLVLSIEGAKTMETRQRRIEKTITMLNEGRSQ
ncbi:YdeI/OmpD-associated family protein [Paenibacillus sp. p3-SID867]|uniref:YdeI/OmpD-associated family protein n=1 Tax=Paenibacillus sp. p3-SID867 TaxID=2916363 RepID=UPI0021A49374|nr:YdeI/OmpD-associated family protein [Paenibacillus sp. p3-SID867]MCT1401743.1 YdeI/OmpD-associated family protein [Paenibacillus sp. p3-SID867]